MPLGSPYHGLFSFEEIPFRYNDGSVSGKIAMIESLVAFDRGTFNLLGANLALWSVLC